MLIFAERKTCKDMKKCVLLLIIMTACFSTAESKGKEKRSVVRLETNIGNIRIALSDDTPYHRDNFLKLTETGFFDGTLFHRVIKDFMIQGGDPESKNAPQDKASFNLHGPSPTKGKFRQAR